MKIVRIVRGMAGKDFTFPAGSLQTLEDEYADRLVRKGLAEHYGKIERTAESAKAKNRAKAVKPPPQPQPEPKKEPAEETKKEEAPPPKEEEKQAAPKKTTGRRRGRKPKSSK